MNVLALRCQMHWPKKKNNNEAFSKKPIESKFKALAEKYCSPENCNLLTWESGMISLGHQESRCRATGSSKIWSPRGSGNYTCRWIANSVTGARKKRQSWTRNYCSITCAILYLSLTMLLFRSHWNAESSWSPIYQGIFAFFVPRLRLCLAFFLEMS